jgi:hypothetical protein
MSLISQPVIINFNVLLNADSEIQVFGSEPPTITGDVIVSEIGLPVNALYDASGAGLIEFWEPDSCENQILCALADSSDGNVDIANGTNGFYKESAKRLARGFQKLLCGRFDCSAASPNSGYTNELLYYKQRDFARVALGNIAHHLFGHVDATAAITNDISFIKSMLSITDDIAASQEYDVNGNDVAARYNAWGKKVTVDGITNVYDVDETFSGSDANLAVRIMKTIIMKGFSGLSPEASQIVNASGNEAQLAYIAKQVLGQDASRLQTYDNSERTVNKRVLMKFLQGDTIYIQVRLPTPVLTNTGTGAGGAGNAGVDQTKIDNAVAEQTYTLKIVLTAPDAAINSV